MSNTIIVNGIERHLGLLPTPAATIARMHREGRLTFSHEHPTLRRPPRAERVTASCRHFFKRRKDQASTSMCVGFGSAHAMIGLFAKQGFDVDVCPASIYAPICGGSDNGASGGDAFEALLKYGCLPVGYDGIDDWDWQSLYRTKFWQKPNGDVAKEAKKLLLIEGVFCGDDVDAWMDGLESGQWAGTFCLGAGSNFDTDADGWLPTRGPTTGINHLLCATGGIGQHPKTGEYGPEGLNSWSGWGDEQFFYCTEKWLRVSSQELWLARAAVLPL